MSQSTKKALIILTSHTELGSTGQKTGFYYDEMATPYWRLIDAGFDIGLYFNGSAPDIGAFEKE